MKKIIVISLLVLGSKCSFSQLNCFQRYPIAFSEYDPFVEDYLDERFNHGPKNVKCIKEYYPKLSTSPDSIKSMIINNELIDSSLLYISNIYKYDSLGRLIEYDNYYEPNILCYSVRKTYTKNKVIRIGKFEGEPSIREIFMLNELNLPISMYKDEKLSILYYYNELNNISKIIKKRTTDIINEYNYIQNDNTILIKCMVNGVMNRTLTYNDKSNLSNLSTFTLVNPTKKAEEWLFSYNVDNKITKKIHLYFHEPGFPYSDDITYIYNSDGTLYKQFEFDDISKDIFVREYQYFPSKEIRIIYNYYLTNKDKFHSLIVYRYEYL